MKSSVTWELPRNWSTGLHKTLLSNDRAAFTERCGECRDMLVVEVVNRGSAFCTAGDAADLLDDVSFECDRGCEDEGVESWEVHTFACNLGHGNKNEGGCVVEGLSGGFAVLGRLCAVECEDWHGEVGVIAREQRFEGTDVLAALD